LFYILSSLTRTLYIGVTNSLTVRTWQHNSNEEGGSSFTRRYDILRLVYFEYYEDIRDAIAREKQLKRWRRLKKNALIEKMNPDWNDSSGMLKQQPRRVTPYTRSFDRLRMTEKRERPGVVVFILSLSEGFGNDGFPNNPYIIDSLRPA
jgi:putative endonuclease